MAAANGNSETHKAWENIRRILLCAQPALPTEDINRALAQLEMLRRKAKVGRTAFIYCVPDKADRDAAMRDAGLKFGRTSLRHIRNEMRQKANRNANNSTEPNV